MLAGKSDVRKLLTSLDPVSLVRLTADVLFATGFHGVRITDGPGDGMRDIHAIHESGFELLVQCKHHVEAEKTCSSAETGELPVALMKFGLRHGLFATNARISPQAKKEFLSDYPDFNLWFLDGDQLARTVLHHPVLRAIWFDGVELVHATTAISFPLIIREHSSDASFLFPEESVAEFQRRLSECLSPRTVMVSAASLDGASFEPYRAPTPLTAEEGPFPFLRCTDVRVVGITALHDLSEVAYLIGGAAVEVARNVRAGGYTARIGRARATMLSGDIRGSEVPLDVEPLSVVCTPTSDPLREEEFIAFDRSRWTAESDARVSEADDIRLYNLKLDVAATYEIRGRPSLSRRTMDDARLECFIANWRKSVHALVPAFDRWNYSDIPQPDDWIASHVPGRTICSWFIGDINFGMQVFRTINGSSPIERAVPDNTIALAETREALGKWADAEILDPDVAYHMIAIVGTDQFHRLTEETHNTAEVTHYPKSIPSPIIPMSRTISILAAWKHSGCTRHLPSDWESFAVKKVLESPSVWLEKGYVVVEWGVSRCALSETSTSQILSNIDDAMGQLIERMGVTLYEHLVTPVVATKEYWFATRNVTLGIDPKESGKAYLWGEVDGQLKALVTGGGYKDGPIENWPHGPHREIMRAIKNSETNE